MSAHLYDNKAATEPVVIFSQGDHRWIWLGGSEESGDEVSANQFLVQAGGKSILLDPGSILDFSRAVANLSRFVHPKDVDVVFFSHQDPDVSSAAPLWAKVTGARIMMSGLWSRFVPHFGELPSDRMHAIPDAGDTIELGSVQLQFLPAHFLHAPGNFAVYDPIARILFSGDIGANLPPVGTPLWVDDFAAHLPHLDGFHRRYMANNAACRLFLRALGSRPVEMMLPQHGCLYRGGSPTAFLRWFGDLRCGTDLMGGNG